MITSGLTRRAFLETGTAAALATRLFAAPQGSTKPNPDLENLGAAALREAKKLKASYADIRIIRYRQQFLTVRLNPERGTGKILEVPVVSDGGSFGFGVRVIVDGAWGFAASPLVAKEEIARMVGEAVAVARANAAIRTKPVELAPVPVYRERWQTPHERDPFAVPLEEKLELIRTAAAEVKKEKGVFSASCNLSFRSEDKYFASSEGSSIQQLILQIYGQRRRHGGGSQGRHLAQPRSYEPQHASAGWEYVPQMNLAKMRSASARKWWSILPRLPLRRARRT